MGKSSRRRATTNWENQYQCKRWSARQRSRGPKGNNLKFGLPCETYNNTFGIPRETLQRESGKSLKFQSQVQ